MKDPLLVVEGRSLEPTARRVKLVALGVLLAVGGAVVLASFGAVPWLPALSVRRRHATRLLKLVVLVAAGMAYGVHRWLLARTSGKVSFHADEIHFATQRVSLEWSFWTFVSPKVSGYGFWVPWSAVTGFDDGAADHVTLTASVKTRGPLHVPTLSEADRVAVLRLLVERGVPRV